MERWYQIHPRYRAKMIAYMLHRRQRENYEFEARSGKNKANEGWDRMLAMMH